MIRNILHIIVLILISVEVPAQIPMGARSVSLGMATTSLSGDDWALFSNPANANAEELKIGFYGIRNYGISELTDISAVSGVPTPIGTAMAGVHRYGFDLFSETRLRFGLMQQFGDLSIGGSLNYNHLSIGNNYGSGGAFSLDVGMAVELSERLRFGMVAVNPFGSEYKFEQEGERLVQQLAAGFSYRIEESAMILLDVVKDIRFPVSYRAGLEAEIIERLRGRVGVTSEPVTLSAGFGYRASAFDVNIAIQHHQILGMSPALDFIVVF